jgi:hypothetical protein
VDVDLAKNQRLAVEIPQAFHKSAIQFQRKRRNLMRKKRPSLRWRYRKRVGFVAARYFD